MHKILLIFMLSIVCVSTCFAAYPTYINGKYTVVTRHRFRAGVVQKIFIRVSHGVQQTVMVLAEDGNKKSYSVLKDCTKIIGKDGKSVLPRDLVGKRVSMEYYWNQENRKTFAVRVIE